MEIRTRLPFLRITRLRNLWESRIPARRKRRQFVEVDQNDPPSKGFGFRAQRGFGNSSTSASRIPRTGDACLRCRAFAMREAAIHDAGSQCNDPSTLVRSWARSSMAAPSDSDVLACGDEYRSTRDGARRLGLVTIDQMIAALVHAVEKPPGRVSKSWMSPDSGRLSSHNCRKCASILFGAFLRSRCRPIIFDPTLKNEGVGPRASVRWSLSVKTGGWPLKMSG